MKTFSALPAPAIDFPTYAVSCITYIVWLYTTEMKFAIALQWHHNELRVTGLCGGDPPVTGGFSPQRDSNAENVST